VFQDIGSLVHGSTLSLVLLPGHADRVVVRKPQADALQVTGGSGGTAAPPLSGPPATSGGTTTQGSGSAPVGGSMSGGAPPPSGVGGGSIGAPPGSAPPSGGLPSAPSAGGSGGSGQVAAPQQPSTSAATTPAAAHPLLSSKWARIAALVLVAAEVAGFMVLHRRRTSRLAPAMSTVGGRLRAPDIIGFGSARANRGVGRFARDRDRPATRI
jgi:hypothetical protein